MSLDVVANAERYFAQAVTWDWILKNAGWSFVRIDAEGRVEWTRPIGVGEDPSNVNPKSATTDWPANPHIMSLLSDSPVTGLADLKEANVPLTKWRVFVQVYFHGNESAALEHCVENGIF
jgi:hypothetical protein